MLEYLLNLDFLNCHLKLYNCCTILKLQLGMNKALRNLKIYRHTCTPSRFLIN